ncbi:MAG TPA: hypothetical protein VK589_25410 [Chryseolinea sp.]|nr:hypothetical protein [Chryseolinea sp.]
MQQFTVRPDSFKEIQKKLIKFMVFVFCGILFLVLGVPLLMSDGPSDLGTLPYMVLLFGGIFAFSILNAMKKQKVLFESFKLIIDDEKITRERLNTPVIVIYKRDVQRIVKSSSGAFSIEGDSKLNAIGIPPQIDNYDLLEKTLNEIKPLTLYTKKTFLEQMFVPILLSVALLFFGHFYIADKIISIICGILLVLLLGVGFYITVTNKNVDQKTKRMSYLSLIVVVVVIFSLYNKL